VKQKESGAVQQQPHSRQQLMHSHSALIILQQALSPVVQQIEQPSLVISQRQWQQVKLHWHSVMPFQVQTTQQVSPAKARQRFCSMPHETWSSHEQ
jgi:hypothetical protein